MSRGSFGLGQSPKQSNQGKEQATAKGLLHQLAEAFQVGKDEVLHGPLHNCIIAAQLSLRDGKIRG